MFVGLALLSLLAPQTSVDTLPHGVGAALREATAPRWDEGLPGELWVRGATYKARVDSHGLTYVPFLGSQAPRNWPLGLRPAELTLGEHALALPAAEFSRRGDDEVVLERGALREVLRFEASGVEQSFELDALPVRAPLRLELEVETELAAGLHGEGLRFEGPDGGVDYGAWTVLDAAGARLDLPSRLVDGRVVLELGADFVERAVLPLRLDPFLSTFGVNVGPLVCEDVETSFVNQSFLVVWTEKFSSADADINTVGVSENGVVLPPNNYVDMTTADFREPSVGCNAYVNHFIVASTKDSQEVWGRVLKANSQNPLSPFVIANAADGFPKSQPSMGSDVSLSQGVVLLCAYTVEVAPGDHDIHARLVWPSGGVIVPTIVIDDSVGADDVQPRVSPNIGHAPQFLTERWNVTWARDPQGPSGATDLWAAQLNYVGVMMTPPFNVTQTPGTLETVWADARGVSSVLDDPTDSDREWAMSYVVESGASREATVALLRKDQVRDVTTLAALTGQEGVDTFACDLDSDGAMLAMTALHDNVVACYTLRTAGGVLSLAEGPVVFDPTPAASHHLALGMKHKWSATPPTVLVLAQEGPNAAQGDLHGGLFEMREHLLGTNTCNSNPNSTGTMAWLSGMGSEVVADNLLTLDVEHLPPFQIGIAIFSSSVSQTPFGAGTLCLGSPVHRINQGHNSGAGGVVGFGVDLTALPGVTIQPGETWHFQFWYRDSGQVNFSNSTGITFQ